MHLFSRSKEYCLFPFELFAQYFTYASSQSFHLPRFSPLFVSLHFTMAFEKYYSCLDRVAVFEIHFNGLIDLKKYFNLAKLPKYYFIWSL
jgi:hypothetical protein